MKSKAAQRILSPAPEVEGTKIVQVDVQTLSAAFKLAYLAGLGERERVDETLHFVRRTAHRMRHSMRRAIPTPQAGVEAGLDLIEAAATECLGRQRDTPYVPFG